MSGHHTGDRTGDSATNTSPTATRRTVLSTAAAGAGGLALGGTGLVGTAASQPQIPTPRLGTDGNVLVDPDGNTVTLRGVNVIDPRRADTLAPYRGRDAVEMVDLLTDQSDGWYTQVLRVPLQPSDIAKSTTGYAGGPQTPGDFTAEELETYLEDHVDDVVDRCEERGVYCILDYHRHWTNSSAEGENPEFDGYWGESDGEVVDYHEGLQEECVTFWDVVAERYGNRSHTIFEVYNEPTEPGLWGDPRADGAENWAVNWVGFVHFIQPAIDKIAEHTDNLQILGSPSWTQSPEGILVSEEDYPDWGGHEYRQIDEPEHLAMTYHIYPGHTVSMNDEWDQVSVEGSGTASLDTPVYEEYPLIVTEFGWDNTLGAATSQNPLPGTTSDFGTDFFEWLESHEAISWTAWCGDIWWDPTMFERGEEGWESHTDTDVSNPYEDEIPQDCPETPCEWHLLGSSDEEAYEDHMGQKVKEVLAEYRDHNNPGTGELEPPTAPADVSTTDVTATSVGLEWEPVDAATSYRVTVDGESYQTSSTTLTITGLEPETTYTLELRAENAAGSSEPVETQVTTEPDDGGECPAGTNGEATVEGQTVCSVRDDELYRDFNADGSVTQADVTEFFSVQHKDGFQSSPGMFDYNGNDSVGLDDVVYLFQQL